jgi:hypothetical protein
MKNDHFADLQLPRRSPSKFLGKAFFEHEDLSQPPQAPKVQTRRSASPALLDQNMKRRTGHSITEGLSIQTIRRET